MTNIHIILCDVRQANMLAYCCNQLYKKPTTFILSEITALTLPLSLEHTISDNNRLAWNNRPHFMCLTYSQIIPLAASYPRLSNISKLTPNKHKRLKCNLKYVLLLVAK